MSKMASVTGMSGQLDPYADDYYDGGYELAQQDNLPVPHEHPDWAYHYVRSKIAGGGDTTNMLAARRGDGRTRWEVVPAGECPELDEHMIDGYYQFGDLVLHRMPKTHFDAKERFKLHQARTQLDRLREKHDGAQYKGRNMFTSEDSEDRVKLDDFRG